MKTPRKAIVLAAGYGSRMDPLSQSTPKPLMPMWGRPTIDHTLDILANWGVHEALVNLHHGADSVFLRLQTRHCPRLCFSFEPEILGTGGALKRASWFIGDAPFWLVNSDIAFDLNPRHMLRDFSKPNTVATLWLTDQDGPRTVETRGGKVLSFRSARAGQKGTYTFCGLHLISPEIVNDIQHTTMTSIVDVYQKSISRGKRIGGVSITDAYWADLGTPESYLAAHSQVLHSKLRKKRGGGYVSAAALNRMRQLRAAGILTNGFASISPGVSVAKGARLHNVVALDAAAFGPGCNVNDAIVASPIPAGASITRLCLSAEQTNDRELQELLARIGWPVLHTLYQPFAPRGSDRSFARIVCGNRRAVVIQYDETRPENARFVANARFLAAQGIPVPEIIRNFPSRKTVVVEDIGDQSLEKYVPGCTPRQTQMVYKRVLDMAALLHGHATRRARQKRIKLEQPFDANLYAWERELFNAHYCKQRLKWPATRFAAAMQELRALGRRLCEMPRVLIHRDLQSSNIFLRRKVPVLIDFQGMRFGVAEYDLASLISDPYVCLPAHTQQELLRYYATITGTEFSSLLESYGIATVQRLSQAIGAYANLGSLPGTTRFQAFIVPGLKLMNRALRNLDNVKALERLVDDALQQESSLGA